MAKNGKTSKTAKKIAKLNDASVLAIKQLLSKGATQAAIVEKTGLKRSTVWNIAAGKTWAHIKVGKSKKSGKSAK